jgi:hypothetical protein
MILFYPMIRLETTFRDLFGEIPAIIHLPAINEEINLASVCVIHLSVSAW